MGSRWTLKSRGKFSSSRRKSATRSWRIERLRSYRYLSLTIWNNIWRISNTGSYLNNVLVGFGVVQNFKFRPWIDIQRKKPGALAGCKFSDLYCKQFSPPRTLLNQNQDFWNFFFVLQKLKKIVPHDRNVLPYLGPGDSLTLRATIFAEDKFWQGCTSQTGDTAPFYAATFLLPYHDKRCSPKLDSSDFEPITGASFGRFPISPDLQNPLLPKTRSCPFCMIMGSICAMILFVVIQVLIQIIETQPTSP